MKKDINEAERKKIISQEMSRRNKLRKHPSGGFYDKQKAREAGLKGLKKRWGYVVPEEKLLHDKQTGQERQ